MCAQCVRVITQLSFVVRSSAYESMFEKSSSLFQLIVWIGFLEVHIYAHIQ